ncbi:WD40-repeat-containing domain protein [Cladorrhinum sp. PSN332]|nr:WD40-repeat-containing domain protein [Cladorrhinum sp. PSN332]
MVFAAKKPAPTGGNLDRDIAFPQGPEDTISAVRWSPVANHLAAASWDGKVYVYDATNNMTTDSIRGVSVLQSTDKSPFFDCDFSKDGTLVAGASAGKTVYVLNLASGSSDTLKFEGHEAPIRSVRFVDIPSANAPIIASGSWDKTIRYWDLRQPSAVATIKLGERAYAMDASGAVLCAVTADNNVHFVNLHGDPSQVWRVTKSPLAHQPRSVSVAHDGSRWAIGSIEGRAAAQATDEKDTTFQNLSFKCHRNPSANSKTVTDVYAVNTVAFSPVSKNVLATAGSDGIFTLWDVASRSRLRGFPNAGGSLTAAGFNRDGTMFAYAVGYDWSKGYTGNTAEYPRKLVLHKIDPALKK